MLDKREKLWLRKLEGAKSDSLLVMNPEHAGEIARRLNLPKENIFGNPVRDIEKRKEARQEAERIEKARLERQRRKARARMQKRRK